jgi:hypothetical protein
VKTGFGKSDLEMKEWLQNKLGETHEGEVQRSIADCYDTGNLKNRFFV